MSEERVHVGFCEWCDSALWKPKSQRGRNPRFCSVCKDDDDIQREVAKKRQAAQKKKADDRVDQLMKRLERVEERLEKVETVNEAPHSEGPPTLQTGASSYRTIFAGPYQSPSG